MALFLLFFWGRQERINGISIDVNGGERFEFVGVESVLLLLPVFFPPQYLHFYLSEVKYFCYLSFYIFKSERSTSGERNMVFIDFCYWQVPKENILSHVYRSAQRSTLICIDNSNEVLMEVCVFFQTGHTGDASLWRKTRCWEGQPWPLRGMMKGAIDRPSILWPKYQTTDVTTYFDISALLPMSIFCLSINLTTQETTLCWIHSFSFCHVLSRDKIIYFISRLLLYFFFFL